MSHDDELRSEAQFPPRPAPNTELSKQYHKDIVRLPTRLQKLVRYILAHPRHTIAQIAKELQISADTVSSSRIRAFEKLGALHPISMVLHPERAINARIEAIPPCPRCGLRHASKSCYLLSIEDYASMRHSC